MSYYPYLLLAVSCGGVVSNVASLFVFARQRFRKMFHRLLVLLALYDFMVSKGLYTPIEVDISEKSWNLWSQCHQISRGLCHQNQILGNRPISDQKTKEISYFIK